MYIYISLNSGNYCIVEAETVKRAEKFARWEFGNSNVDYARKATDEEMAWYEQWNGIVHQAEVKGD